MLTATFSRRAGGIFSVVRSLAEGVQHAGMEVRIFAGADTETVASHADWRGLPVTIIPRWAPAAFPYLPGLAAALRTVDLDVVHTHGIWMYPSVAAIQWARVSRRPYMVSPHGMLDAWALKHAGWKKRLAGILYENAHLRGAACLHATSEAEAHAIRAHGLGNPICIIPNGVELPTTAATMPGEPAWAVQLPSSAKALLYLGRIHPKKNLSNLLQAWALISSQGEGNDLWHLIVAGWDQGDHQAALTELAVALNITDRVHFVGPQFGSHKSASLNRADAFVLPSLSEGLPVTVLEAWAHGLPVLMSPQCNLPEGFSAAAALAIEPGVASIAEGLHKLFKMEARERDAMGQRGRALAGERFAWAKISNDMCAVYKWMLGNSPTPDCVQAD